VIWIYAIGDRAEIPPPLSVAGLAGAPLEGVGEGRLLAVISRHAELPDIGAVDALWAHEHVVERLMAERTVLPVRFASRLTGEAALRHELAIRQDDLLAALDGVRGRVELAVRAMSATGPPRREARRPAIAAEGRHSGREYVRAKLALRDRAEAAGAALHVPLAALAVAGTRRPGRVPCEVLRASYLVERPVVAEFRALAQQLQSEYRDMAVLCTGPWPPYSFVEVAVSSWGEGGGG
jgi:Gas vesicle synthesis protein GvpL/GvpF